MFRSIAVKCLNLSLSPERLLFLIASKFNFLNFQQCNRLQTSSSSKITGSIAQSWRSIFYRDSSLRSTNTVLQAYIPFEYVLVQTNCMHHFISSFFLCYRLCFSWRVGIQVIPMCKHREGGTDLTFTRAVQGGTRWGRHELTFNFTNAPRLPFSDIDTCRSCNSFTRQGDIEKIARQSRDIINCCGLDWAPHLE